MKFNYVVSISMNLHGIYMEFFGVFILGYCLWIGQALNDAQKKQEQDVEKRIKEKLKNDQYLNVRIIEKL